MRHALRGLKSVDTPEDFEAWVMVAQNGERRVYHCREIEAPEDMPGNTRVGRMVRHFAERQDVILFQVRKNGVVFYIVQTVSREARRRLEALTDQPAGAEN